MKQPPKWNRYKLGRRHQQRFASMPFDGWPYAYDRKGRPITYRRYVKLMGKGMRNGRMTRKYKGIRLTRTRYWWVSTVWLAIDHGFLSYMDKSVKPVIFETMVFPGGLQGDPPQLGEPMGEIAGIQERYCTEKQAIKGHHRVVHEVYAAERYIPRHLKAGTSEQ